MLLWKEKRSALVTTARDSPGLQAFGLLLVVFSPLGLIWGYVS